MSAERWAIVEIMGHRVRAGRVSEVTQFGVVMCRIEIPTPDGEGIDHVEDYGGGSIFAIAETTKEKVLERYRQYTPTYAQLARENPTIGEFDDVDDDPEFIACSSCAKALLEDDTTELEGRIFCNACAEQERATATG